MTLRSRSIVKGIALRTLTSQLLFDCWAEARIKIARMTLTIKLDRNWSSFQLANSAPPLSVTDSAIAPSARMGIVVRKGFVHTNSVQAVLVFLVTSPQVARTRRDSRF